MAAEDPQLSRLQLLELRITYDLAFDRIVHNAVWLSAGEVNMREKMGAAERRA